MTLVLIGGTFLGCMAVSTPENRNTGSALLFMDCIFIGWNETICLANSTLLVYDQCEIGIAGGIVGTIRASIAILVATYSTVLTNRLTTTNSTEVAVVVIKACLSASSAAQFTSIISISAADALKAVCGITNVIIAVGLRAYKVANEDVTELYS